jgi:hypothetical protein
LAEIAKLVRAYPDTSGWIQAQILIDDFVKSSKFKARESSGARRTPCAPQRLRDEAQRRSLTFYESARRIDTNEPVLLVSGYEKLHRMPFL